MAYSAVLRRVTPAADTVNSILHFVSEVVTDSGYFGLFGHPIDLPGVKWAQRIHGECATLRGVLSRLRDPTEWKCPLKRGSAPDDQVAVLRSELGTYVRLQYVVLVDCGILIAAGVRECLRPADRNWPSMREHLEAFDPGCLMSLGQFNAVSSEKFANEVKRWEHLPKGVPWVLLEPLGVAYSLGEVAAYDARECWRRLDESTRALEASLSQALAVGRQPLPPPKGRWEKFNRWMDNKDTVSAEPELKKMAGALELLQQMRESLGKVIAEMEKN